MLLRQIEICNFRAFYNVYTLQFSIEPGKAVTIFHGENGAGKTNLLNAVYWCVTGKTTPRLKNPERLINREAYREGQREAYVELNFVKDGKEYRARRTFTSVKSWFELFQITAGNSSTIPNGEGLMRKIIPLGLADWFFFDAEAVGALELSGSSDFKKSIRATLGFELIDGLISDLELCKQKRQKEATQQVNSKDLKLLQERIDNINHVLPAHQTALEKVEQEYKEAKLAFDVANNKLRALPEVSKLHTKRSSLESREKLKKSERTNILRDIASFIGTMSPSIFLSQLSNEFLKTLEIKELQGKLPSPYSDQLVEEILKNESCICGRAVAKNSKEEEKIRGLLQYASTGLLNQRIRSVQYLGQDISKNRSSFAEQLSTKRAQLSSVDTELSAIEEELSDIKRTIQEINEDEIKKVEESRDDALNKMESKSSKIGELKSTIARNKSDIQELQSKYENLVKKLGVSEKTKKEQDKISRLFEFVKKTQAEHELKALNILSVELNTVLEKYLVKHFKAQINPLNYAVKLLDPNNEEVGESTGEGQVLKFAFISAIVALAAKKTQEKIEFLAEPTIAPLVLDAPYSVLDPEYQGSVAKNLASQSNQLVLMVSSGSWGQGVSDALSPYIGKEYLIISKEEGSKGDKPLKRMVIRGKEVELNVYDAERTESVIEEVVW